MKRKLIITFKLNVLFQIDTIFPKERFGEFFDAHPWLLSAEFSQGEDLYSATAEIIIPRIFAEYTARYLSTVFLTRVDSYYGRGDNYLKDGCPQINITAFYTSSYLDTWVVLDTTASEAVRETFPNIRDYFKRTILKLMNTLIRSIPISIDSIVEPRTYLSIDDIYKIIEKRFSSTLPSVSCVAFPESHEDSRGEKLRSNFLQSDLFSLITKQTLESRNKLIIRTSEGNLLKTSGSDFNSFETFLSHPGFLYLFPEDFLTTLPPDRHTDNASWSIRFILALRYLTMNIELANYLATLSAYSVGRVDQPPKNILVVLEHLGAAHTYYAGNEVRLNCARRIGRRPPSDELLNFMASLQLLKIPGGLNLIEVAEEGLVFDPEILCENILQQHFRLFKNFDYPVLLTLDRIISL